MKDVSKVGGVLLWLLIGAPRLEGFTTTSSFRIRSLTAKKSIRNPLGSKEKRQLLHVGAKGDVYLHEMSLSDLLWELDQKGIRYQPSDSRQDLEGLLLRNDSHEYHNIEIEKKDYHLSVDSMSLQELIAKLDEFNIRYPPTATRGDLEHLLLQETGATTPTTTVHDLEPTTVHDLELEDVAIVEENDRGEDMPRKSVPWSERNVREILDELERRRISYPPFATRKELEALLRMDDGDFDDDDDYEDDDYYEDEYDDAPPSRRAPTPDDSIRRMRRRRRVDSYDPSVEPSLLFSRLTERVRRGVRRFSRRVVDAIMEEDEDDYHYDNGIIDVGQHNYPRGTRRRTRQGGMRESRFQLPPSSRYRRYDDEGPAYDPHRRPTHNVYEDVPPQRARENPEIFDGFDKWGNRVSGAAEQFLWGPEGSGGRSPEELVGKFRDQVAEQVDTMLGANENGEYWRGPGDASSAKRNKRAEPFWEDGHLGNLLFGKSLLPGERSNLSRLREGGRSGKVTALLGTVFKSALVTSGLAFRWASVGGIVPQPLVAFSVLSAALCARRRISTALITLVALRAVGEFMHGPSYDGPEPFYNQEQDYDGGQRQQSPPPQQNDNEYYYDSRNSPRP